MSATENWREANRFRGGPREAAISHLSDLIADGKAGLDQYDRSIFVAVSGTHLQTLDAINAAGTLLSFQVTTGQGMRLRATLQPDVRLRLGLDDGDTAPLMDEPLASRRVGA